MKNFDRLLIVLVIFIVLACKCQSDLFKGKSSRTGNYSTPITYSTPYKTSPTPNPANFGEYHQCSERQNLNHNNVGGAASLVINNKSAITVSVYRLGANNYQSKYDTLTPGKSVTLRSSARGEWWMITDVSGNCKMIVSPPNEVNIK